VGGGGKKESKGGEKKKGRYEKLGRLFYGRGKAVKGGVRKKIKWGGLRVLGEGIGEGSMDRRCNCGDGRISFSREKGGTGRGESFANWY